LKNKIKQIEMKKILIILSLTFSSVLVFGQYSQYQLKDTSERVYQYTLPIFGAKTYEKGFDIPLPVGIMVNYFTAVQDVAITEISVGFDDGLLPTIPLTDITRIIDFEEVTATATSINVRPDVWILPFLNVYGILGKSYATTGVKISYPFELETVAELEGSSFGCGITGAFGVGKFFTVLDGNWVWSNMDNFTEPVYSSTFSARLGKTFKFKKKPDRRDEVVNDYWEWHGTQDPAKQDLADRIFTPIINNLSDAEGDGTIHYKLLKEPVQEWNVIIGGQYQYNPKWQLRAEGGIIGNRKSLLISVNYRFGFKRLRAAIVED
jgi:hypothetical protein